MIILLLKFMLIIILILMFMTWLKLIERFMTFLFNRLNSLDIRLYLNII